jgi:hypothetical protein
VSRQFYVLKDDETAQTSDRFEAKRIATEWVRRGYDVETVVVEVTDETVEQVAA